MYIKLRDTGSTFQETGQRVTVKGDRIVKVRESAAVEKGIRSKVIKEATEAEFEAQTAADEAAAKLAKQGTTTATVVSTPATGGQVGGNETPEAKAARELAEKLAKLPEAEKNKYNSLPPDKKKEYEAELMK